MAPNSVRADSQHVAEHAAEAVEIMTTSDVKRLMAIRAALAALVAGLGALAAAATGDVITLQGWLVAAASAAGAAGAIYGVGNGNTERTVRTEIPRRDLAALHTEQQRTDGP